MQLTGSNSKYDALVHVINASYEKLRDIEAAYGLPVGKKDLRPRIEYFHDAVRILGQRPQDMYLPKTRLSVEHLAYDMSCLRYIQDRPLAKLMHDDPAPQQRNRPQAMPEYLLAPVPLTQAVALAGEPRPVPPAVKVELAQHYRSYAVLFAALFAESADTNFNTRVAEQDAKVEDMAQIEQMLAMLEQGKLQLERVEEAIQQIEDVGLRTQLMAILHQRTLKKRERFNAVRAALKQGMAGVDMDIKTMDRAHMNFLSGQMVLYQDAKDLIRELSSQGMAMAGKFLQEALSQGVGRGQGHGR